MLSTTIVWLDKEGAVVQCSVAVVSARRQRVARVSRNQGATIVGRSCRGEREELRAIDPSRFLDIAVEQVHWDGRRRLGKGTVSFNSS